MNFILLNVLNSNLYANLSIPHYIGHDGTRKIYESYFSLILENGFKSTYILDVTQIPVYAPLEMTAIVRIDSGDENNWCFLPLDQYSVFYGATGLLTINITSMLEESPELANARVHGKISFASNLTIN